MARSYRKNLVKTSGYGSSYRRWAKRYANKKIRNSKDVPDGKAFRKFYQSYDIKDWVFRYDPDFDLLQPLYKWRCK